LENTNYNYMHIQHLSKSFGGNTVVDNISFDCLPGQITALIGPNGSGKSTSINLLTGVVTPDSGKCFVSEHFALESFYPRACCDAGMTRTFQQVRLFNQQSALDNVLVVLTDRSPLRSLFTRHSPLHMDRAVEILKKLGLQNKMHTLAGDLSYGQQKLLELARVLAMDARSDYNLTTVFFDEPFAGLFPEIIKIISQTMAELAASGKSIVLVEHNMDLIRQLCDQCYCLDAGRILASGSVSEVLSNPAVIEAYLGL
jgi:ABC-type branched-subunit amino acid transport system ATPase component